MKKRRRKRGLFERGGQRPASPPDAAGGPPDGEEEGRSRLMAVAALIGAVAALVGAVAAVTGSLDLFGGSDDDQRRGDLRIVGEPYVTNGPVEVREGTEGSVQTQASSPTIHILVSNRGGGSAQITRVRVTITDFEGIWPCVAQGGGDVETSSPYVIRLPTDPLPEERDIEVVDVPKHVDSQGSEHLLLRFAPPDRRGAAFQLYALRVSVETGQPKAKLDAGRFVISTPGPVARFGEILPENDQVLHHPAFVDNPLRATWCYRRNLAGVRRLLSSGGRSSEEVAALRTPLIAPDWVRVQDDTPARLAALRLLRARLELDEPELAVFAAHTSRDEALEQKVRVSAASKLLDSASRRAGNDLPGAADEIRRSLRLRYSPGGKRQLLDLERRIKAGEE